jgi:hypothetical protein
LHPLLARDLMPVSKSGNKRVVQHDELRAPSGQLYGLHVLLKVWGSETLSHYSFPGGHILPFNLTGRFATVAPDSEMSLRGFDVLPLSTGVLRFNASDGMHLPHSRSLCSDDAEMLPVIH